MKRILTGDRTTGKLHIGHYVGSLKSRVELQDSYEEFILIADVQALTTHFSHPEMINDSIYNVCMDNIAAGLDPEKVTFIQQSMIPAIAELTVFYSMLTTVNHLLINPTIKTEARSYGMGESDGDFSYDFSKLTYGFLGYPVSQSADITFCNADLVPVGEDQVPHMEFTRRLVRHFNELYGTEITVPQTKLSTTPRLAGLDGNAKMGKSLGNAIYLSDTPDEVWDKVRNAVTDTNRVTGEHRLDVPLGLHGLRRMQEADEQVPQRPSGPDEGEEGQVRIQPPPCQGDHHKRHRQGQRDRQQEHPADQGEDARRSVKKMSTENRSGLRPRFFLH